MVSNGTSITQQPRSARRSIPLEPRSMAAALIVLLFPAFDPSHVSLTGQKADRFATAGEITPQRHYQSHARRLVSSRPGRDLRSA